SEGLHMPRALATTIVYLVALVALGALIFGLVTAITEQVREVSRTFPATASQVEATLRSWQQDSFLNRFGINLVAVFNSLQAILVTLIWVIFGLPYLFLVATLSALAMFIPFFGPPLALLPPIIAAWFYGSGWFLPITIVLIAVQTVAVNWLQPRLMRGALGMHPILVPVALLVGAQVAGVWGALSGIPVVAGLNRFPTYSLWSR